MCAAWTLKDLWRSLPENVCSPHSPSHVVHTERKIHTPNSARVRKRLFLYIHNTYSSCERFCVCVLYAGVRVSYFSCKCEWYWHFYMKLALGADLSVMNSAKFVVISWRLSEHNILYCVLIYLSSYYVLLFVVAILCLSSVLNEKHNMSVGVR